MKCKKHNIEMRKVINLDLGNLRFKPTMQCKVCEQSRYNPWHEAEAKKFEAKGNFARAKKHRDMIVN